jgi:hypothetical protein
LPPPQRSAVIPGQYVYQSDFVIIGIVGLAAFAILFRVQDQSPPSTQPAAVDKSSQQLPVEGTTLVREVPSVLTQNRLGVALVWQLLRFNTAGGFVFAGV